MTSRRVSREKISQKKSIFDQHHLKYDEWYAKNRFAYLSELEAIKKVLPKQGRGLEIGVGTGRFSSPLGIDVGIDPSRNMLDIAQQRGVITYCGYGENLPFLKETFNYVVIVITLCFVQNPQKVLRESRRVLKKNGKLIIGIIDKNSFLGKLYRKKESLFYKQAIFFSTEEVTDLFKITGFNQFSYLQTIFQLPNKMKSIEKPQKGFDKGSFVVISGKKTYN